MFVKIKKKGFINNNKDLFYLAKRKNFKLVINL